MTKVFLIVGLLIPTVVTTRNTADICRPVGGKAALTDLPEASGVTAGSGPAWPLFVIGDSGAPVVTLLDQSGAVQRKVAINGARVTDWEAITLAKCGASSCLYVADIGDNGRTRRGVTLYRVLEAAMAKSDSADAEAIELAYPDGPHDAESVFATGDGQLFIVTKERGRAVIFRAPHPLRQGGRNLLSAVMALDLPESKGPGVTDAAVSRDGKWIALRGNDALLFYRSELLEGRPETPIHVNLRGLGEPQGEGVAFGANGLVFLVGEGGGGRRPGSFVALRCELPSS